MNLDCIGAFFMLQKHVNVDMYFHTITCNLCAVKRHNYAVYVCIASDNIS